MFFFLKKLKLKDEPGARHWIKIKKDYLQGAADSADLVLKNKIN